MKNIINAALADSAGVDVVDSKALSQEVFHILDTDKSHSLDVDKIASFMSTVGHDPKHAHEFAQSIDKDHSGTVSSLEFYRYVWQNDRMRQFLIAQYLGEELDKAEIVSSLPEKDRATIVFKSVDLDDSGDITTEELSVILTAWGLPESDASSVVKQGVGNIDLGTFTTEWKYFWIYAYANIQEELCSADYHIIRRKNTTIPEKKKNGREKNFAPPKRIKSSFW